MFCNTIHIIERQDDPPKKTYYYFFLIALHPGLMVLWNDKNDCNIVYIRWQLFLLAVWPTFNVTPSKLEDDELLLPTLSVFYLYVSNSSLIEFQECNYYTSQIS